MDKKAKKRLNVINKKLQTLRPRLSGSREQADDAEELKALEDEITSLEEEAALKLYHHERFCGSGPGRHLIATGCGLVSCEAGGPCPLRMLSRRLRGSDEAAHTSDQKQGR